MVNRDQWDGLHAQANGGAEPVSAWAEAKERIRTQAKAERSSGSASRL